MQSQCVLSLRLHHGVNLLKPGLSGIRKSEQLREDLEPAGRRVGV